MRSLVQCIGRDRIKEILDSYRLQIDPDEWYPLQLWLDILAKIENEFHDSMLFVSIGMQISEMTSVPDELQRLEFDEMMVKGLDQLYKRYHRKGDVGNINVQRVSRNKLKIVINTPYPNDLQYGMIYGFAKRFLPKQTDISIRYDDITTHNDDERHAVVFVEWQE